MQTESKLLQRTLTAAALFAPVAAHAHHAEFMSSSPLLQGLSMPVHGIDHMLSALAVGMVAGRAGGKLQVQLPVVFAAVALLGGALNLGGVSLPELAVPLSVAAAGLMLWKGLPKLGLAVLLAACAGLFNGQALLAAAPSSGAFAVFALGCLASGLSLCALGVCLGRLIENGDNRQSMHRVAGAVLLLSTVLVTLFPSLNSAVLRFVE